MLASGLEFYWEIFDTLSHSRHYDMMGMPNPIPMSEIVAYCALVGLRDVEARMRILILVQAMDTEYLLYKAEEMKRKSKDKGRK